MWPPRPQLELSPAGRAPAGAAPTTLAVVKGPWPSLRSIYCILYILFSVKPTYHTSNHMQALPPNHPSAPTHPEDGLEVFVGGGGRPPGLAALLGHPWSLGPTGVRSAPAPAPTGPGLTSGAAMVRHAPQRSIAQPWGGGQAGHLAMGWRCGGQGLECSLIQVSPPQMDLRRTGAAPSGRIT